MTQEKGLYKDATKAKKKLVNKNILYTRKLVTYRIER